MANFLDKYFTTDLKMLMKFTRIVVCSAMILHTFFALGQRDSIYNQTFEKQDWLYPVDTAVIGPRWEIRITHTNGICSIKYLNRLDNPLFKEHERYKYKVLHHSKHDILFLLSLNKEYTDLGYLRLDKNGMLVGWCIDTNGTCCVEELEADSLWNCPRVLEVNGIAFSKSFKNYCRNCE